MADSACRHDHLSRPTEDPRLYECDGCQALFDAEARPTVYREICHICDGAIGSDCTCEPSPRVADSRPWWSKEPPLSHPYDAERAGE